MKVEGFLARFLEQHQRRADHPFCFILGAGASQQSGIPTGAELAKRWLEEMRTAEDFEGLRLEEWATAERLSIAGFSLERCREYYPDLYERRFKNHPENGYAHLEKEMDGKEPSFGYGVLAYIMSETEHRIVITTNFDNLMGDALSIHSTHFPLILGHDSLAGFASINPRRPLVAKIHGAIGFQPKNTPEETQNLFDAWKKPLHDFLDRCTPVVIGYAGNDGSLMGFLEELPDGVPENAYWLVRSTAGNPREVWDRVGERTRLFVKKKKGAIVPIPGFDEIMLLLYDHLRKPLEWPDLFERLKERARAREEHFDTQMKDIKESLRPKPAGIGAPAEETVAAMSPEAGELSVLLREAAARLTEERVSKPWWQWEEEVASAANAEEKEAIYRAGLDALPRSAPLLGNYAIFLNNDRKDYDRAEEYYKRAIEADPKHPTILGNYAVFLKNVSKDYDRAEEYYRRAIEADPKNATNLGNYAGFLFARGRLVEAIDYIERAEAAQEKGSTLEPELLFYRAAHIKDSWPSVLARLKQVLESGTRSPGWRLEANIERASKDGHPNVPLLRALASVITEGGDLSLLNAYPEWVAAGKTA